MKYSWAAYRGGHDHQVEPGRKGLQLLAERDIFVIPAAIEQQVAQSEERWDNPNAKEKRPPGEAALAQDGLPLITGNGKPVSGTHYRRL
jgi:hypothetical protein